MGKNKKRIAIYGGSFNPVHDAHLDNIEKLVGEGFDVIIIPCGPRDKKETNNDIEAVHKAWMLDIALKNRGLTDKVRVDYSDLEKDIYTRTWYLAEKYNKKGEVLIVIGTDIIKTGEIKKWRKSKKLLKKYGFIVFERPGYKISKKDMPPKTTHELIFQSKLNISSTNIRTLAFQHKKYSHLVPQPVHDHIENFNLYRGAQPNNSFELTLKDHRPFVLYDEKNEEARRLAKTIKVCNENPNFIYGLGGDGKTMRIIRSEWQRRMPIFVINAGHKGHLASSVDKVMGAILPEKLIVYHLQLLFVEVELISGEIVERLACNDAYMLGGINYDLMWGPSAKFSLCVKRAINNKLSIYYPEISGDGFLAATRQGSTGYARSMGASPLNVMEGEDGIVIVGSNLQEPVFGGRTVGIESRIEIINNEPDERPMNAFVDSIFLGVARRMKIRVSRTASVQLGFLPDNSITRKNAEQNFPGAIITEET